MMMGGVSIQEMNDPGNFQYRNEGDMGGGLFKPANDLDDGGYEDPDQSGFDFNHPRTPTR